MECKRYERSEYLRKVFGRLFSKRRKNKKEKKQQTKYKTTQTTMENKKLQELTEKLYEEGLSKGRA
ncbi:MAG: hypothetical protein II358_02555, partial [Tidjanibacter sp.]|nr:hypothetical protein [Tidjanibacter sp.]